MRKPATTRAKTIPGTKITATVKKPEQTSPNSIAKPRRRAGVDFNLKILYPKPADLRKAIFMGQDVEETFRKHIIESGLFRAADDGVSLVLPPSLRRHRAGGSCVHPEALLNGIATVLAGSFVQQGSKKGVPAWKMEIRVVQAIATIAGYRELFMAAGAPQKEFDKTVRQLERWKDLVVNAKADGMEKTDIIGLRVALFKCCKRHSRMSESLIYAAMAQLLKYLGLEAGKVEEIVFRLKTCIHTERRRAPGLHLR